MTKQEYAARTAEIKEKITTAGSEDEINSLANQAKELRKEYEMGMEKEVVKTSVFNPKEARSNAEPRKDQPHMENREAFRAYMEKRADATTKLEDIVLPNTVTEYLKQKNIGKILAKTTQTAYPTGYDIVVNDITGDTEAHWVNEGSVADREKLGQSKVSFKAHKVMKRLANTREVEAMSLPQFEQTVATRAISAVVKAVETAIFNGSGTASPKGITKETGINTLTYAKNYQFLLDMLNALDEELYDGEFYMNKTTFFALLGMTDTAGQPIARTNAGIDGKPANLLLGRPVNFVKALKAEGVAVNNDIVIAYGDMSKYAINNVQGVQLDTFKDHDKDETVYSATALLDGKLVDKDAFVLAKKVVTAG